MKMKLALASLCLLLTGNATPVRAVAAEDALLPSRDEATPKDNSPYAMIIARNVFRLNPAPPPPPPAAAENPAAAAGGLKLTGFFKFGGEPVRALFVNVPSNPTNTVYYNLTEGERDGALELLKINEAEESAEVVHAGNRITVMLKDSKPASTGGPAAAGGQPGVVPGAVVRPGTATPVPATPVAASSGASQAVIAGGSAGRGSANVMVSGGMASAPMVGGGAYTSGANPAVASTAGVTDTSRTIRATSPPVYQNNPNMSPQEVINQQNIAIRGDTPRATGIPFPPPPPGAIESEPPQPDQGNSPPPIPTPTRKFGR